MNKSTSVELKGIWASIQLPILPDQRIDYETLQDEIEYLASTSVHGIYSNGTAAEFYNQTEAEFDEIHGLLASICKKVNRPFQIGASHMSPIISLERVKRSKSLDPFAFQIILPHWMKLNTHEIFAFLDRMIEAADPVPIVLYNPGHAQTYLTPIDFKRLSDKYPQIIGIKTGGGDAFWYEQCRSLQPDLAIFVPGHRLATGIKEGVAQGSYSNMACLDPNATRRWYDTMLDDIEESLRLEKRLQAFFEKCILPLSKSGYSDAALDKFLWSLRGRKNTHPRLRWPYQGIDPSLIHKVREVGEKAIPEFFY